MNILLGFGMSIFTRLKFHFSIFIVRSLRLNCKTLRKSCFDTLARFPSTEKLIVFNSTFNLTLRDTSRVISCMCLSRTKLNTLLIFTLVIFEKLCTPRYCTSHSILISTSSDSGNFDITLII